MKWYTCYEFHNILWTRSGSSSSSGNRHLYTQIQFFVLLACLLCEINMRAMICQLIWVCWFFFLHLYIVYMLITYVYLFKFWFIWIQEKKNHLIFSFFLSINVSECITAVNQTVSFIIILVTFKVVYRDFNAWWHFNIFICFFLCLCSKKTVVIICDVFGPCILLCF